MSKLFQSNDVHFVSFAITLLGWYHALINLNIKNMKQTKNSNGFSHQILIALIVIVGFVGFAGGYVYNVQQKQAAENRAAEAARDKDAQQIKVKTTETAEKTVEIPQPVAETKPVETAPAPAPAPTKTTKTEPAKTKTQPTITYVTITSVSADVSTENVIINAVLPGNYSGYCKVLVKMEDGSNAQWFENAFGPGSSCGVAVPKSKLIASTTWKYYTYMKTSDGLTKGEAAPASFSL